MFGLVVDGDVGLRVNTVLFEQVFEDILGCGAFTAGDNRLPLQVSQGFYVLSLGHQIEHAQSVDAQDLDTAAGLVPEGGCQVGGNRSDVQLAGGDFAHDLFCCAGQGEGIGTDVCAVAVSHHFEHPEAGGAFEAGNAHGDIRDRVVLLAAFRDGGGLRGNLRRDIRGVSGNGRASRQRGAGVSAASGQNARRHDGSGKKGENFVAFH